MRTLLLSATPYKMYTLRDEEQEDHYADFLNTARFLMGEEEAEHLAEDLRGFRQALLDVGVTGHRVLIDEAPDRAAAPPVHDSDRAAFPDRRSKRDDHRASGAGDPPDAGRSPRVCRRRSGEPDVAAGDITEYWKSSPYLLNFMSTYKLKRDLRDAAVDPRVVRTRGRDRPVHPPHRESSWRPTSPSIQGTRGCAASPATPSTPAPGGFCGCRRRCPTTGARRLHRSRLWRP